MSCEAKVAMSALAVAYKAKLGDLDQIDVDQMITLVQQLLPSASFLAKSCTEFATQHELHWQEPARLADLGEKLRYAVELDARPDVDGGDFDG